MEKGSVMPLGTLVCRTVSKSFGAKLVLDRVSLNVAPAARIGLIGANGAGKSTLLRVLAGLEVPDAGAVSAMPPDLLVGYLPQEPDPEPEETVLAYLARRTGVAKAEAEVDRLAEAMQRDAALAEGYSRALDAFVALGGGDLGARAAAVAADVGLGGEQLGRRMATLSGGQRARAALASILLARFDVFLLDEPTNDLDFDGLERLESHLDALAGGLVVVSHDRAFLERSIDRVLEIEEGTQRATEYAGGWSEYLRRRELERQHAYTAHERYVAERRDLAERARRIRAWAEQGAGRQRRSPTDNNKAARDHQINRTEKQASKVRSVERRLERLEPVEKPWEPWQLRLQLQPARRSGDLVARLDRAVVDRGGFRLGPLSLEVRWSERLAVLGPNGSGKTTLLEAILGRIPLTAGERWVGPGVTLGTMDQGRRSFATPEPLLDVFCGATGMLPGEARTLLAKFRLGDEEIGRPCATLSPGERTRGVLAELMARGVNCLVLDEPTNHLDLPAIEELERALGAFDGTLLVVTHDRKLLEALRVDRRIELTAGALTHSEPG